MKAGVTHLITNNVISKKYQDAVKLNISIITEEWIQTIWKSCLTKSVPANDNSDFERFKCPVFLNLLITTSNLSRETKREIKKLISENGGEYEKDPSNANIDVVIADEITASTDKINHAVENNIPILKVQWIFDCIKRGHSLPYKNYLVKLSEETSNSSTNKLSEINEENDLRESDAQENTSHQEPRNDEGNESEDNELSSANEEPSYSQVNKLPEKSSKVNGKFNMELRNRQLNPEVIRDSNEKEGIELINQKSVKGIQKNVHLDNELQSETNEGNDLGGSDTQVNTSHQEPRDDEGNETEDNELSSASEEPSYSPVKTLSEKSSKVNIRNRQLNPEVIRDYPSNVKEEIELPTRLSNQVKQKSVKGIQKNVHFDNELQSETNEGNDLAETDAQENLGSHQEPRDDDGNESEDNESEDNELSSANEEPAPDVLNILNNNKKKKKRKRQESFGLYIYKMLKQVHPGTGSSKKAIQVINSFIFDFFEKIATEAARLVRTEKKHTMTSRDVQYAIKFLLTGGLLTNAISEGNKALNKYESSKNK